MLSNLLLCKKLLAFSQMRHVRNQDRADPQGHKWCALLPPLQFYLWKLYKLMLSHATVWFSFWSVTFISSTKRLILLLSLLQLTNEDFYPFDQSPGRRQHLANRIWTLTALHDTQLTSHLGDVKGRGAKTYVDITPWEHDTLTCCWKRILMTSLR